MNWSYWGANRQNATIKLGHPAVSVDRKSHNTKQIELRRNAKEDGSFMGVLNHATPVALRES